MKDWESSTKLSNSERGKLWLSQFEKEDQDIAKLLLDDLIYVPNSDFIAGLKELIDSFAREHDPNAIALFAARENKGNPYWRKKSKPPKNIHAGEEIGSEGIIANLCRDIANKNQRIYNHPSIERMRKNKCEYLLFVDDIIASGTRMQKFAKWFYDHKTIKSWHSFGYVKFISCTYMASIFGENNVSTNGLFDKVLKVHSNGYGRSIWSEEQREKIVNLCRKYASFTSRPSLPLGYKEAFTTVIFPHTCPNTNPAILWASKENSWDAIFSDRPEFAWKNEPKIDEDYFQNRILKALGHTRLTKPSFFQKLNSISRQKIVLLSCIASGKRSKEILSDIMGMEIPTIRHQLEVFKDFGWINENFRITERGKKLLKSARKNDCLPNTKVKLNNEFYHPKTYRGSTISSSPGLRNGDSH